MTAPVLQSNVLKRWLQGRPGGFEAAVTRAFDQPARLIEQHRRTLPHAARRTYAAAQSNRLTDGWTTTSLSSTASLLGQLDVLRARSRQLHKDNEYAERYQQLVSANIVGPQGFRFEARVTEPDGTTPDNLANAAIEQAWARWSARGSCEASGRLSLREVCHLLIKAAACDGEYLARWVRGTDARNPFGLAIQVLDVNRIDTQLNRSAAEGVNAILMGIEVDTLLRPVAYHLRPAMQGDIYHLARNPAPAQRIPAEDILHGFVADTPEQVRGVPWMHAAMLALNNLGGYQEAAIIASRIGASKMGFFTTPEGQPDTLAVEGDGTAEQPFTTDAAPGQFDVLPEGYQFQSFNPEYPVAMFGEFVKANLRGIASGLGVTYHGLANDLEGVSYSSIRSGTLEERDGWMVLQQWFIDAFLEPVFTEWLRYALAMGQCTMPNGSALPLAKLDKFQAHSFQGRRWAWVDPLKDVEADIKAMQAGLRSPQDVAAGMGSDLETVLQQIQAANAMADRYGVTLATMLPALAQQAAGQAAQQQAALAE
jgi:lambda family phage portal protein